MSEQSKMTIPCDTEATCAECGDVECYEHPLSERRWRSIMAVEFRWLCNSCWHSARHKQQAYCWRRNDGYRDPNSASGLYHEMVGQGETYPHWYGPNWAIVPCEWYGDRIAHPGYMARRRAAILTAHPEYGR